MTSFSSEIKAFLIMDCEGRQICCKYYSDEFKSLEARVSIAVILFALLNIYCLARHNSRRSSRSAPKLWSKVNKSQF
jgi:hypothetical protein